MDMLHIKLMGISVQRFALTITNDGVRGQNYILSECGHVAGLELISKVCSHVYILFQVDTNTKYILHT